MFSGLPVIQVVGRRPRVGSRLRGLPEGSQPFLHPVYGPMHIRAGVALRPDLTLDGVNLVVEEGERCAALPVGKLRPDPLPHAAEFLDLSHRPMNRSKLMLELRQQIELVRGEHLRFRLKLLDLPCPGNIPLGHGENVTDDGKEPQDSGEVAEARRGLSR